jgi:hypothetical protein
LCLHALAELLYASTHKHHSKELNYVHTWVHSCAAAGFVGFAVGMIDGSTLAQHMLHGHTYRMGPSPRQICNCTRHNP